MNKAIKILDKVISLILIVLVAFLAVGITFTIVMRYFFSISYAWLEEFLTMSFIFITLFGSAIAIREKQHIAITLLANKVCGRSETRKKVSAILVDAVILFVCVFMTQYSIKWINQVGHLVSQNSHLPMKVFYIAVPVSFVLTAIYTVIDIVGQFVKIDEPDSGYSTDDKLPEGQA